MQAQQENANSKATRVEVDPDLIAANVGRGWWRDRTIVDDLIDHAARTPDKPAIIAHRAGAGVESLTYAELKDKVDQYAAALLALGIQPGDVVSFQLPNWWQINALHLACGRIGAVTNALSSTLASDPPERAAQSDGKVMEWNELRVFDDNGVEVPRGTIGRLGVRGASLLVTYFKRPDIFEQSFIVDDWFDTGDLAYMDDQDYIRIAGRSKDLVIRGGENIPVVEVEGVLLEHPEVEQIAIVGVPDERLGERAAAVVVPSNPDAPPTLSDLTAFLAAKEMAKQFWPESVTIVDELPKTATGKIQKFLVKDLASPLEKDRRA